VFFRAESVSHAFDYLSGIFSASLFSFPKIQSNMTIILIVFFVLIEWIGRREQFAIAHLFDKFSRPVRWGIYYCLILVIFYCGGEQQEFIYFQF
jgi:alginate O-acetyltransferase complex protein AlgI